MFIVELFEQQAVKKVVIMPGGFHPWHPGHTSLYSAAAKAFPDADLFVAATADTSERPFPFDVKRQLALISGVPAERFVQVKSPFQPREITSQYDPESTVLIFVRSDKDRTESPQPGGVKKNGEPSYLQPYNKNPSTMNEHGYIAYLPTIEFRAGKSGISSATQIRQAWPSADAGLKAQIVQDLYPKTTNNQKLIQQVVSLLDSVLGGSVAEESSPHVDSRREILVKRAKAAYPRATSDEEALLLYLSDRDQQDIDRLDRENDQEEEQLDQLSAYDQEVQKKIQNLEDQIAHLTKMINQKLSEDAAGVGVIANKNQANDPRYSMSLTQDVRPGQVEKSLAAFHLIPKKRVRK